MPPKDYIVYIDADNVVRAVLDNYKVCVDEVIVGYGSRIIGYVSSGSEADAIAYGQQVLAD